MAIPEPHSRSVRGVMRDDAWEALVGIDIDNACRTVDLCRLVPSHLPGQAGELLA